MSEDKKWAIQPEGDIDKVRDMGRSEPGAFNKPFQPLTPLPTREVAAQVEQERISIGAKDTIRLEEHTLRAFAAANWVTKIEFQAVMSHIRIITAERDAAREDSRMWKLRCESADEKNVRWITELEALRKRWVNRLWNFITQRDY